MTIALPVCPSFTGRHSILCQCKKQKPLHCRKGVPEPQNGFSGQWDITVGGQKIESRFLGEAHTKDNIVTWIPSEHILFGGCQVKSLGSAKGNLADANVDAWSETTRRIKQPTKMQDRCTGAWGCRHNRTPGLTPSGFWPRKAGIISAAFLILSETGCEMRSVALHSARQCNLR